MEEERVGERAGARAGKVRRQVVDGKCGEMMDGMRWDGMEWDGMGWDGMGWDGMRCNAMQQHLLCQPIRIGFARSVRRGYRSLHRREYQSG